jgi:hypothetical protein
VKVWPKAHLADGAAAAGLHHEGQSLAIDEHAASFIPSFCSLSARTPFTATVLVTRLKYECLLVVNWMPPSLASHLAYYIVNRRLASVCLTELNHNIQILSESCGVGRLAESMSLHAF